jgi:hypothetical protein
MNLLHETRYLLYFKNNLQNETCNISIICFKNDKTIEFLKGFYDHIGDVDMRIYLLHSMLQYMLTVYTKTEIKDSYIKLLLSQKHFQISIIKKIKYFQDILLKQNKNLSNEHCNIMLNTVFKLKNVLQS